ncbi:hypothetical protein SCP_0100160 [Sparassis crispa]|uniref:F-box domain-containing protein n=1 Tax=Sparassis crispa TaxID=139825 RepID=A0A401G4U2_9APHY|nr:hypothetical protein SCP_0100160 [Sparassis crispa]GBE77144.1 hypothetical protein SCP_0100160 [Sparassis crispa]
MQAPAPLRNKAILRQIFHYDKVNNRTLARLARTCKAFSEPALDELWWFLDDFTHLLTLLRLQCCKVPDKARKKYVLQEEPSAERWARFHSYARRVRRAFMPMAYMDIHPSVYTALAERSHKQPLFPSLRDLLWPYDTFPDYELVELVICIAAQSIKSLRWVRAVDCGPYDDQEPVREDDREPFQLEALCRMLANEAPSLQTLELGSRFSLVLLRFLAPCKRLTKLQISFCTVFDLLQFCAPMECLAELDACLVETFGADIPLCAGFPALEKLTLGDGCAAQVARLLRAISSPDVRYVKMDSLVADSWMDVGACLDALDARVASSLRVFHLGCDLRSPDKPTTRLTVILQPLFRFYQLEDISIRLSVHSDLNSKIRLSDRDISELASAWPKVTSIRLDYPPAAMMSVFTALATFAQHCPSLSELRLGIALDDSPSALVPPTRVASACRPHGLTKLQLAWGELDIRDPVRLARFLFGTFPALDLPWMCANGQVDPALVRALRSRQVRERRRAERREAREAKRLGLKPLRAAPPPGARCGCPRRLVVDLC